MRTLVTIFLLFLATSAWGQLVVTGSSPANGATNVPLTTTLAIAFNAPIDTAGTFVSEQCIVSNVTNTSAMWYSAQQDTVFFNATLDPGTAYFVMIFSVKSKTGGQILQAPAVIRFTTASSFPAYSVSGTVQKGSTPFEPSNALVVLSTTPLANGQPTFVMGTFADSTGAFTIPDVGNGTYYPVAARDVVPDGRIESSLGDAICFGDAIVVNNGDFTGLTLTFTDLQPIAWNLALDSVAQHVGSLPSDKQLRWVYCYDADSLGRARDVWEFSYTSASHPGVPYQIRVGLFEAAVSTHTDPSFVNWIENGLTQIPDPAGAASAESFVTKAEAAGGLAFRNQSMPSNLRFIRSLSLGRLAYSNFSNANPPLDPGTHYWGVEYRWLQEVTRDSSYDVDRKQFIGDFATGNIVQITGIANEAGEGIPEGFSLGQNYPNPFNPSTTIRYAIPRQAHVKLTVFNTLGQQVATVIDAEVGAGYHEAVFDATGLAAGMYLYRFQSGGFVEAKRFILLK